MTDYTGSILRELSQNVDEIDIGKGTLNKWPDDSSEGKGVLIGSGASTGTLDGEPSGINSVIIGGEAKIASSETIAIGYQASVDDPGAVGAVSIGFNASRSGYGAGVVIGQDASDAGGDNVVIGKGAQATGGNNNQIAIGTGSSSDATGAVAFGQSSVASGNNSVALGDSSEASQDTTVSLGAGATTSANQALALGSYSEASATGAVAIGVGANVATSNVGRIDVAQFVFGGADGGTIADANLNNGELTLEFDEANNNFVIRGKDSTGTVQSATVNYGA